MANMFFFNYLINYSDWCNLHEYCKESSGSENLVKTFLERSISYIGSLLETANLALITFFFPVRNINFDFFSRAIRAGTAMLSNSIQEE